MNCYKISCPLKSLETPLVTAEAQGKWNPGEIKIEKTQKKQSHITNVAGHA